MPAEPPPPPKEVPQPSARAATLLRVRRLWIVPVVVGAVFVAIMTTLYIGAAIAPLNHLHGLPVSVVNEDAGGTTADGQRVNLGDEVTHALTSAPAVATRLGLRVQSLASARERMDRNGAYATVVIPRGFTASLLTVAGAGPKGAKPTRQQPAQPAITVLTNPRAGTQGTGLATGVLQPALTEISAQLGRTLQRQARDTSPAAQALLANPVAQRTVQYRPLPSHSALGLSAFYVALLTLMCGFLGATIVNATVDGALGYSSTELGPRWTQRRPREISRWQTLLTKWGMAIPLAGLLTAVMLFVGIVVLGADTPDPFLLWAFSWFGAATVGVGTLGLLAALGTQGQLVALVLFVYIGLSSAGGTVPIEALPGFLRWVSEVDPLRQILDGVRSIMYFDARLDAGLARGLILTAVGLAFWLLASSLVVRRYDRKGLVRLQPQTIAAIDEALTAHAQQRSDNS